MAANPPPAYPAYPGQQPQYGAPPPAYPQQGYTNYPSQPVGYAAQTNTVVLAQPQPMVIATVKNFGANATNTTCQHCRQQILTRVEYEVGTMTWLACFLLWFVGLWCCCFIPFCMDNCKDAVHYCPNCSNHLGTYSRM
ncbi:lipopolysaccharide-induced tumor necrosis factor-alpha factor homolog [Ptychodera flava]|uniref:lipopolysaccharide-induced tumor necrosis factor-alpha factor homolog n=1 Tax=Ptychodera flava TaxID=63121 RepID=UPI00396A7726